MLRIFRTANIPRVSFSKLALRSQPVIVNRRFQSTTEFQEQADKWAKNELSVNEEQYDVWIKAIRDVREQLNSQPWDPEQLLAAPGESKADLNDVSEFKWTPSEHQIAERDALIGKAIPKLQDDTLNICINIIMKHGKKEKARKGLSQALYHVYLHTREDPVQVFKTCLRNLTPLTETKVHKTGFAKNQVVPVLVTPRKGLILAFKWILEGANKRASSSLGVRLGEEILAVYSGKSSGFEKRAQLHKQAMLQRAHLRV